jgi:hypothetical protein
MLSNNCEISKAFRNVSFLGNTTDTMTFGYCWILGVAVYPSLLSAHQLSFALVKSQKKAYKKGPSVRSSATKSFKTTACFVPERFRFVQPPDGSSLLLSQGSSMPRAWLLVEALSKVGFQTFHCCFVKVAFYMRSLYPSIA